MVTLQPLQDPSKRFFDQVVVEPSYVIFQEAGKVFAKNGKTGQIEFSGTDASAVIQAAINALTSGRTWKEKVVVKGNFTLTKQSGKTYAVGLPDYTILEICGKLMLANGQNCDVIANVDQTNGNRHIEIIGGAIDGNKGAQAAGNGIKLKATPTTWAGPYCYKNVVRNVHVYNCKEHGFKFEACNDLFITNCYAGILNGPGNGLDGFYFDGSHEVLIVGCHSTYNGRDGYRVTSTLASNTWENQIVGCASENNSEQAYHIIKGAYDLVLCLVTGSTCDDCANGVVVDDGRDITIASNSLSRGSNAVWIKAGEVLVSGNSLTEAKVGVRVAASGIAVIGNSVRGKLEVDEYGVYLESGVNDCLVANNRITNISTNTEDQAGVLLYGNNMRNLIVGNSIFNVGRFGIRLAANAVSSYNTIVANRIYNCASGIGINGAHTYNIVSQNHVQTATYYGISLYNGADYNRIFENTLDVGTPIGFSAAGANNVIKRNVGYVTENSGTATFSGNGTQTAFTIAHGCASTPNHVSLEAKSADASGDKYWSADATNITVTFITAPPAGTDNVVIAWKAEV
ncbi:MAG: right-handed parallel beta-helix repeat-containing protein [Candidatus Norongarragalinales archaeon]